MDFIRSTLVRDRASATEVLTRDLPTNPLSHLILAISGYNATDEATLAEVLGFLNKVEVTRSGVTILSLESEDLYALNCYLFRRRPVVSNRVATDDATRTLGLIIPFGRRIFDPDECHPATSKGDLSVRLDLTILGTSIDNGIITLEAVELPGATPQNHLKASMRTITAPGATGDHDVDLPIGNRIAAVQVRQTSIPTTAAHTYGVNDARILANNRESGYASARAQALLADQSAMLDGMTGTIAAQGATLPDKVFWLDYAPHLDDRFLLDTTGLSSLKARLTMGVDEATYVTPIEIVAV